MPTYDYVCETCGHEFEMVQSMKDPKLTDCPQSGCAGTVRRRLGTGAGVIFKGSGFYETDYRSASYKEEAKKEKIASKPASESGAPATEGTKPKETKSSASEPAKAKPASSGTTA